MNVNRDQNRVFVMFLSLLSSFIRFAVRCWMHCENKGHHISQQSIWCESMSHVLQQKQGGRCMLITDSVRFWSSSRPWTQHKHIQNMKVAWLHQRNRSHDVSHWWEKRKNAGNITTGISNELMMTFFPLFVSAQFLHDSHVALESLTAICDCWKNQCREWDQGNSSTSA